MLCLYICIITRFVLLLHQTIKNTPPMNTNILNGVFAPQPTRFDTALLSNTRIIILADGCTITLYSATNPDSAILTATLPAPPLCALDCGDTIIIMTADGPRYIFRSAGEWTLLPPETAPINVNFHADTAGIIQSSTISFTSKSGVSLAEGLQTTSALQRKITAALAQAYTSLLSSAREGGYYIQPVVARCLFLDSAGATVAVSAPQLVGVENLWQCVAPVTASVAKRTDTDFTIAPFTLSATPWRLRLSLPGFESHPHAPRVAQIKVLVSKPVDILDKKEQSPVRFAQTHGNTPVCTAAVPGATASLSSCATRFREAAAKIAASTTAFALAATLAPHSADTLIPIPDAPAPCPYDIPESFAASAVIRSGSCVLWADGPTVIAANTADPLVPLATARISAAPVTALTPASRSQSTWDFSRAHLYAFSAEGVYAVSFSPRQSLITASLIDNRPALGPAVFTPAGVFAAVSGGLITITGSHARSFIPLPEDIVQLYCVHKRYASSKPSPLVLAVAGSGNRYWVTPEGDAALIGAPTTFRYEQELAMPKGRGVRCAVIPLIAETLNAKVEITADSGCGNAASFCCGAATISGIIEKPLLLRLHDAPHRSRISLVISGSASSDLSISPATIINL